MKRPLSITIIAWIFIVTSVIGAAEIALTAHSHITQELIKKSLFSPMVLYLISFITLSINFICGIAFLKGKNWSRYLYVITGLIAFGLNIIGSEMRMMMIPGAIFFIIIIMFLFIPKNTNVFFKQIKQDGM